MAPQGCQPAAFLPRVRQGALRRSCHKLASLGLPLSACSAVGIVVPGCSRLHYMHQHRALHVHHVRRTLQHAASLHAHVLLSCDLQPIQPSVTCTCLTPACPHAHTWQTHACTWQTHACTWQTHACACIARKVATAARLLLVSITEQKQPTAPPRRRGTQPAAA
jgi:hypothetical protein